VKTFLCEISVTAQHHVTSPCCGELSVNKLSKHRNLEAKTICQSYPHDPYFDLWNSTLSRVEVTTSRR